MKTREDLVSFLLTAAACDLDQAERFAEREKGDKERALVALVLGSLIALGTVGFLAWGLLFV